MQYEDTLQNISEEFNELITQLTKEQEKPISIFYNVELHSFLTGKYKYYCVYINDDIIPGEKGHTQIKYDLEKDTAIDVSKKKIIKKMVNHQNFWDNNLKLQNEKDGELEKINELGEFEEMMSNDKNENEKKSNNKNNKSNNKVENNNQINQDNDLKKNIMYA